VTKARPANKWEGIVREYLARQDDLTREEFARSQGVGAAAFKLWLSRLTLRAAEGGRVWAGLATPRPTQREGGAGVFQVRPQSLGLGDAGAGSKAIRGGLGERDLAILRGLAHDRMAGVDVIALRHWGAERGADGAALGRLRDLERRGYVQLVTRKSVAVMLTRRGARACGAAMPRRMHPRHLEHHLATLRAIERYRAEVERLGGRFVEFELPGGRRMPYQLEIHVQSLERAARSAHGTTQGTDYDASPDAVVRVALPDGHGGTFEQNVAIEYFTRAYSDEQVQSKMELHEKFDRVVQVCDTATTAERVTGITGASATVLAP
jgi:hypothetical protein